MCPEFAGSLPKTRQAWFSNADRVKALPAGVSMLSSDGWLPQAIYRAGKEQAAWAKGVGPYALTGRGRLALACFTGRAVWRRNAVHDLAKIVAILGARPFIVA